MFSPRAVCLRCMRPTTVCYCSQITAIESGTRVVFLQHPKERRVPVSTCRMAHLSLPNSELHVGLSFEGHARLSELASAGAAVLFPSSGALDPSQLSAPPRTLFIVDGSWSCARKVLERSPLLRELPRIGLRPRRPGNYRIRKEPAEHCLSTIEAVVEVLGNLEKDPDRFRPILKAFDRMVEVQLCHALTARRSRHVHRKERLAS